jgi:hypothetical protein
LIVGGISDLSTVKFRDMQGATTKFLTVSTDSANLADSAYRIYLLQDLKSRWTQEGRELYGDGSLAPNEIAEGNHHLEFTFKGYVKSSRMFYFMMGITDSGWWSTNTQGASAYAQYEFVPSDSASQRLKVTYKNVKMLDLQMDGGQNANKDLMLTGRFSATDVKVWALPVSE